MRAIGWILICPGWLRTSKDNNIHSSKTQENKDTRVQLNRKINQRIFEKTCSYSFRLSSEKKSIKITPIMIISEAKWSWKLVTMVLASTGNSKYLVKIIGQWSLKRTNAEVKLRAASSGAFQCYGRYEACESRRVTISLRGDKQPMPTCTVHWSLLWGLVDSLLLYRVSLSSVPMMLLVPFHRRDNRGSERLRSAGWKWQTSNSDLFDAQV